MIKRFKSVIAVAVLLTFVGSALATTSGPSGPQFREKEGATVVKKNKRFPWLPVLLGVGAAVVVIVLLTREKKQTLNVNRGAGVSGTPASTARYKRGSVVRYDYSARDGFGSLRVRLDGVEADTSGSVTMDTDHTLDVSASEQHTLTVVLGAGVNGTPTQTTVYGRDQVVEYSYRTLDGAGAPEVRLDRVIVPASGTVTMGNDHTLEARLKGTGATFSRGVLTVNGIRYEMALIPAGEFMMGSDGPESEPIEQPVHRVRISKPFWLGRTEVTQALWKTVMANNPSTFKLGDDYPVEEITWDDCQRFIGNLNQMLGDDLFRLPTEAEWEYACRAGTTGERYGDIDAVAWYAGNSGAPAQPVDFRGGHTQPVGLKQPNAFGLYDMLGNVWEWCWDIIDRYAEGFQIDPTGAPHDAGRIAYVYRGGSWENSPKDVRAANRSNAHSNGVPTNALEGVRLARSEGNSVGATGRQGRH